MSLNRLSYRELPEDPTKLTRDDMVMLNRLIRSISTLVNAAGTTISHLGLSDIGVNTHAQIDTALTRLINTSGTNTGDLQVKVGTFTRDVSLSAGNQAITGVGFKPRHLMFQAFLSNGLSIGFDDGTGHESTILDAGTVAGSTSYSILAASGNAYAVVASLDSDGFTLTWGKTGSPTGTATIYYSAIR